MCKGKHLLSAVAKEGMKLIQNWVVIGDDTMTTVSNGVATNHGTMVVVNIRFGHETVGMVAFGTNH